MTVSAPPKRHQQRLTLEACIQQPDAPLAPRIGLEETADALIKRASDLYANRRQAPRESLHWIDRLRLYTLACDALGATMPGPRLADWCPHLPVSAPESGHADAQFAESVAALRRMASALPETRRRFLHIPEKAEVYWGRYRLRLADTVRGAGFEYFPLLDLCRWNSAMFHRNDGHLNDRGYAALARCVADAVFGDPLIHVSPTPVSS